MTAVGMQASNASPVFRSVDPDSRMEKKSDLRRRPSTSPTVAFGLRMQTDRNRRNPNNSLYQELASLPLRNNRKSARRLLKYHMPFL